MYSKTIPESQWGKKELAETYLEKFWLPSAEYEQMWKPIQDRIFTNQEVGLPEMVFASGFEVLVARGGCLFVQEEFARIQECTLALGERFLFVVENTFAGRVKEPIFRMKFPADIRWDELASGNFASAIMLEMPHKEYFVFAESASWGKYAGSDYEVPLDVLGFRREVAELFREKFKLPEAEQREVAQFLPPAYKAGVSQKG